MPMLGDPRGRDQKPRGFPSNSLRLANGCRASARHQKQGKWGLAETLAPITFCAAWLGVQPKQRSELP